VIVWKLDLQLPLQSVPITSDVVGTTIETEDNEPYQPIRSQAIDWLVQGV
jgi:hypothetical protein